MIKNWDKFQQKRTIPEQHKSVSCYAAFNHFRLSRDGEMHPCCFSTKREQCEFLQLRRNVFILPSNVEYNFCFDFRLPILQQSLHQECRPSFLCECLKKNSFVAGKVDLQLKQRRPLAITSSLLPYTCPYERTP